MDSSFRAHLEITRSLVSECIHGDSYVRANSGSFALREAVGTRTLDDLLETLEKVTEKIDKLTVFGGLDGVLKDVVRIKVPSG